MSKEKLARFVTMVCKENIDPNVETDNAELPEGVPPADGVPATEVSEAEVVVEPEIIGEPTIVEDTIIYEEPPTEKDIVLQDEILETNEEVAGNEEVLEAAETVQDEAESALNEIQGVNEVLEATDETKVAADTYAVIEKYRSNLAKRYEGTGILTPAFTKESNTILFSKESYEAKGTSLRRDKAVLQKKLFKTEQIAVEGVVANALVKGEQTIVAIINSILNGIDLESKKVDSVRTRLKEFLASGKEFKSGAVINSMVLAKAYSKCDPATGKVTGAYTAEELSAAIANCVKVINVAEKASANPENAQKEMASIAGDIFKAGTVFGRTFSSESGAIESVACENPKNDTTAACDLNKLNDVLDSALAVVAEFKKSRAKMSKICGDRIALAKALDAGKSGEKLTSFKEGRKVFKFAKEVLSLQKAYINTVTSYARMSIAVSTNQPGTGVATTKADK